MMKDLKKYESPIVEEIRLDKEISLQMTSPADVSPTPPGPPTSTQSVIEKSSPYMEESDGLLGW